MIASKVWTAFYFYQALEILSIVTRFINETPFFYLLIVLTLVLNIIVAGMTMFPKKFSLPIIQKEKNFIVSLGYTFILLSIAVGIMKPSFDVGVYSFTGNSWHKNKYIQTERDTDAEKVKIPLICKYLIIMPMNLAGSFTLFIEDHFKKDDQYVRRSQFGIRAIVSALTTTVDDPVLRNRVNLFVDKCVMEGIINQENFLRDRTYGKENYKNINLDVSPWYKKVLLSNESDDFYTRRKIDIPGSNINTCKQLRDNLNEEYTDYIKTHVNRSKTAKFFDPKGYLTSPKWLGNFSWKRANISSTVAMKVLEKTEGMFGKPIMSETPDLPSKVINFINRYDSTDSWFSLLSHVPFVGQKLEAQRGIDAQMKLRKKYAEESKLSSHIVGYFTIFLFSIFPFAAFFIFIRRSFKFFAMWLKIYIATLLFTPLSLILYKVINSFYFRLELIEKYSNSAGDYSMVGVQALYQRAHYALSTYYVAQMALLGFLLLFSGYQFVAFLQNNPSTEGRNMDMEKGLPV